MRQNHKNKITDDELKLEYLKTPHLGKLSHTFNLPIITIWRRLEKMELKCNKQPGGNIKGTGIPLTEILEGLHPYYQTFKLNKRLIKEEILENKCSICQITEWNNKPIGLHLDHIDGVSSNHLLDNLRLVCPNCHSQTDTYCGKNKK
jgi:hypothetical protein